MEWKIATTPIAYPDALAEMAARVAEIQTGQADELVWLVEHPPLYTLGTSAKAGDVLGNIIPSFETGRGGQVTYHGPGQRVVYLMLDLKKRAAAKGTEPDLRAYVKQLEQWIILTLAEFGIESFTREGRVGVWVSTNVESERRVAEGEPLAAGVSEAKGTKSPLLVNSHEAKIAALGVRVQKWVTSHGIAINVHPDLSHYAGIIPCGIRAFGVTSMRQMGVDVGMDAVDAALISQWKKIF